jgi:hypothetical protein
MRARIVLAAVALLALLACLELEVGAPREGVGSLSTLVLPSPAVVVGDVLRDSTGSPAPIRILAFDRSGQPMPGETTTVLSLDPSVAVDGALLRGVSLDSVGARIVAGAGGLQAPAVRLPVTPMPSLMTAAGEVGPLRFDIATPDSINAGNWSDSLAVRITSAEGAPVQGVIVRFQVIRGPAALAPDTAAVFLSQLQQARASARDTTGTAGFASRRIVLRQRALGDAALLAGTRTDTVVVRASASYAGVPLQGSPLTFSIPLQRR